jgi:hypothetical protein
VWPTCGIRPRLTEEARRRGNPAVWAGEDTSPYVKAAATCDIVSKSSK